MAYYIESLTAYIPAGQEGKVKQAEMFADVLGGKYPVLCSSDGAIRNGVFPVAVYTNYEIYGIPGEDFECNGYDITFAAGDADLMATLESDVEGGRLIKVTVTGDNIIDVSWEAHAMANAKCIAEGRRRSYIADYEVFDIIPLAGTQVSVTVYLSVE